MKAVLTTLWRATLGPVYFRMFRRYFDAIVSDLRTISARLDELDAHVHGLLAASWEQQSLARRMASLEDRLDVDGNGSRAESASAVPERE
jgi:hypothetical protein